MVTQVNKENGRGKLLQEDVHTVEEQLTKEISCIISRNQNQKYLQCLLTRALILEELIRQ